MCAVWPPGELRAHALCRAFYQSCHRRAHDVRAIFRAQGTKALGTEAGAPDLSAQVSDHDLRYPAIVAQDRLDLAVHSLLGPVPNRWNQNTVVEDFACSGAG